MSLESAQYFHDHETPAEPPWHAAMEDVEWRIAELEERCVELRAILADIKERFYGASSE